MLHEKTIDIQDEAEMKKFSQDCAADCGDGDVIMLRGTLGAGKTTFAKEFIRTLTKKDTDVPSPTFTLVQEYGTSKGPLWHFDLYQEHNALHGHRKDIF